MSKFGQALDKEQYRAFKKAWLLKGKIEHDIDELAQMNPSLAFGAIRTGETITEMQLLNRIKDAQKNKATQTIQKEG